MTFWNFSIGDFWTFCELRHYGFWEFRLKIGPLDTGYLHSGRCCKGCGVHETIGCKCDDPDWMAYVKEHVDAA